MDTEFDPDNIQMTWIKLEIEAFEDGIRYMDKETIGYYFVILLAMYRDKGGRLPHDLTILGKRFGTTARVMRRVLDELIGQGKLYVMDGWLRNKRCDEERKKFISECINRHVAAVKRHANAPATQEVSAKFQPSLPETSAKLQPNFTETIENNSIISINDGQSEHSIRARVLRLEDKKKEESKTPKPPLGAEYENAFLDWWAAYPRKDDKANARKVYLKIVTGKHKDHKATPDELLAGARAYAASCKAKGTELQFIKGPAAWLNSARWRDVSVAPGAWSGVARRDPGYRPPAPAPAPCQKVLDDYAIVRANMEAESRRQREAELAREKQADDFMDILR